MNTKKGYTLLFSIIVATVVLSIAAFILSVSRKEFILSSTARDSIYAIYAADSGMQCAVQSYTLNYFSTTTGSGAYIACNGSSLFGEYNNNDTGMDGRFNLRSNGYYKIEHLVDPITIVLPNNTCAMVDIIQGYDDDTLKHKTIIESRGYNLASSYPCTGGAPTNPRVVERATRLIYND